MSEPNFTADRIAADRDICEKATPGPWRPEQTVIHDQSFGITGVETTDEDGVENAPGCFSQTVCVIPHNLRTFRNPPVANMRFIAAARTRWPEYIAEVERLRGIFAGAPHDQKCSAAKSHHLPGYIHYETDAGELCPSYHYGLGKCDCWKSKVEVA